MMGRKETRPLTSVQGSTTLVARDAVITGDISFCGNLDVEGRVVGSITSAEGKESMLRVMEGGTVEGSIHVPSAMVNGAVRGDIHCADRLELAEQAEVDGDVYYNLIEMTVGCKVNGGLRHASARVDDLATQREKRLAEDTP
ncbi:MAG: polymer-forming cytoskeletal protein [Cellvibrionales bacterium]|jgi:cytoskeletal protein CcmA (bactofilin family)